MFGLTDKLLSYVAGAACLVLAIALLFTYGALTKANAKAAAVELALQVEKTGRETDRKITAEAYNTAMDDLRSKQSILNANYQEALNAARKQADVHRRDADAARTESDGLREQAVSAARRLADARTPEAAVREYATTVIELFDNCQREYQGMAATAQGHADDVATLIAAWPSAKPATSGLGMR